MYLSDCLSVCVLDTSLRPLPSPLPRRIDGLIKLNTFYKHNTLTVMVMHVKDLVSIAVLLSALPCLSYYFPLSSTSPLGLI